MANIDLYTAVVHFGKYVEQLHAAPHVPAERLDKLDRILVEMMVEYESATDDTPPAPSQRD